MPDYPICPKCGYGLDQSLGGLTGTVHRTSSPKEWLCDNCGYCGPARMIFRVKPKLICPECEATEGFVFQEKTNTPHSVDLWICRCGYRAKEEYFLEPLLDLDYEAQRGLKQQKKYTPGTVESVLEDRLADLLHHKTIDEEQFVPLAMADIQQDCPRHAAAEAMYEGLVLQRDYEAATREFARHAYTAARSADFWAIMERYPKQISRETDTRCAAVEVLRLMAHEALEKALALAERKKPCPPEQQ